MDDMMNERDLESGTMESYNDYGYPGVVEPEVLVNIEHFGAHEFSLPYDPGVPTPQDTGGEPGYLFEHVNAMRGGVDEWENQELTGRVVRVPSSMEFYETWEGPVGTRDMTDEVGLAIMVDHLEMSPDPYLLREDIAGAV